MNATTKTLATVDTKTLTDVLAVLNTVTNAKFPKPILACVHLQFTGTGLNLESTDLETAAIFRLPSREHSEGRGSVLVNLKSLRDAISGADKAGSVRLSVEAGGETLRVETDLGSAEIRLPNSPDEWPILPQCETDLGSVSAGNLRRGIERSLFACANEKTRYAISGVLLECRDEHSLDFVGTDGRRLAWDSEPALLTTAWEGYSPIIPTRSLKALLGALKRKSLGLSGLEIRRDERSKSISFSTVGGLGFALVIREIDGEFAPYRKVIPTDASHQVEIDRTAFERVLKTAAKATSKDSPTVRIGFDREWSQVHVKAYSTERGETKMAPVDLGVNVWPTSAKDFLEFSLNPKFLLDIMAPTKAATVRVSFSKPTQAMMFDFGAGERWLNVVMPITV